tara:strand:+ start:37 stop:564 length:528 start_codon:yes stop_codon:yes gene_type:complete
MKKRKKKKPKSISNEQIKWKDRKPFVYFFAILNLSHLAIDGLASLLTVGFIIGIALLIPFGWWYIFSDGITADAILNAIIYTIILWICVGATISEFEGLKSIIYIIVFIILCGICYGLYERFKYTNCVDSFRERPFTYDKKKFIDCKMIDSTKANNMTEIQVRNEMIYYYNQNKY